MPESKVCWKCNGKYFEKNCGLETTCDCDFGLVWKDELSHEDRKKQSYRREAVVAHWRKMIGSAPFRFSLD